MDNHCQCKYCKANVKEYFCGTCSHNFNECEVNFELMESQCGDLPNPYGIQLCPKCHSKETDVTSPIGFFIKKKASDG